MTAIYRYIGSSCVIGDTHYDRLGQKAEFDEATFRALVLADGGAHFIPESVFTNDIGFTQAECDTYPTKGGFPETPATLLAKRHAAEAWVDKARSQQLVPVEHEA